jgi:transposase-like protein
MMSHHDDNLKDQLRQFIKNLKKDEDNDWLREMVEMLTQEMLEVEFEEFLGAEPYERSDERAGYRNGYRERELVTRVGRLNLRVPRDREGRFSTQLFERYQRSEKALVLALQESYLQGVSTRKMKKITEKLCGVEFSKDQVSRMAQELDETLEAWRTRQLESTYPYLVVDASYEYIREDGQVISEGVLTVKGINQEGYREILSVAVAPTEEEATWGEVFSNLIDRGLSPEEVKYIVSDEHKGLRKALRRYYPRAIWQRCQAHYQNNAGSKVPHSARGEVHSKLRDMFRAPEYELAQQRASHMLTEYHGRFSKLAEWLEETIHEPLAVFMLPEKHRQRLRTTNGLERYHREVNRRTNVVSIFPNPASCLRLVSALAMEQSEEWLTGRRYLNMEPLEVDPIPVQEFVPIVPEVLPI